MGRNYNVTDLLERFMEDSGETKRWVTVNELRNYYDLDECASQAISGFLQKIYCGSFASCPYRVERIERVTLDAKPHPRQIKKYLVTTRPAARAQRFGQGGNRVTETDAPDILTDYDAVRPLDRVLDEKRGRMASKINDNMTGTVRPRP